MCLHRGSCCFKILKLAWPPLVPAKTHTPTASSASAVLNAGVVSLRRLQQQRDDILHPYVRFEQRDEVHEFAVRNENSNMVPMTTTLQRHVRSRSLCNIEAVAGCIFPLEKNLLCYHNCTKWRLLYSNPLSHCPSPLQ